MATHKRDAGSGPLAFPAPGRVGLAALLVVCLAWAIQPAPARADGGWVLTRADLTAQPAAFQAIDAQAVHVVPLGAPQPVAIPFDRFLLIERAVAAQPSNEKFTLYAAGGDMLRGQPVGIQGEQLLWQSNLLGQVAVPLRKVRAIVAHGRTPDGMDEEHKEDAVFFANGDNVHGLVAAMKDNAFSVEATAGGAVNVPLDAVAWITRSGSQAVRDKKCQPKISDENIPNGRLVMTINCI